jgi:hypothetical protein
VSQLFRFPSAVRRHPEVEAWFADPDNIMRQVALPWFERMRASGEDVRELIHDGCPTACAGEAAFAYVGAFAAHVTLGFYWGAELADPAGLLQGSGKRMRHAKVRWGERADEAALGALITAAYLDIRARVAAGI